MKQFFFVMICCIGVSLGAYDNDYYQQAVTAHQAGNIIQAKALAQKMLAQQPCHQATLELLATLYKEQEKIDESIYLYQRLIAHHPGNTVLRFNAALAHTMLGQVAEAVHHYQILLQAFPGNNQIMYNLGYTYKMAGMLDEALNCYNEVLAHDSTNSAAEYAKTLTVLAQGDFTQGWLWYEKYLQRIHYNADNLRSWIAQDALANKRIVLIQQGGLGDTLQFIRGAKTLHEKGAYIIAVVPKSLHDLLKLCPYLDEIITPGSAIPAYHEQVTIMGLPAVMHMTEQDMTSQVPYLHAREDLVAFWKTKVQEHTFKIGLCWHADNANDQSRLPVARRSIPLALLAPLADTTTTFYSLQQCEGLEELAYLPNNFVVHHFYDDFDQSHGRFMDTAALIKNMDLVITVDTAIAHLAGGLGVPVWLMLPYSTDWRWIEGRDRSPWYPTMQIFKQKTPFDWHYVVHQMKKQLA